MKHIAITGAAGGLGRALTRKYLDLGWTVWAYDLKPNVHTDAFLSEQPGRYHFIPLDITDGAAVIRAAEVLTGEIHGLDVLVNAAGILTKNGEKQLEDFDIEDALRVFDINALGPLRVTKAMLPLLKRGDDRVLVNISSEAGSMQTNNNYTRRYDYCMSKAAVNMQSVILQRALRPDDVKVLAIHPGWMQTEMGGPRATTPPEDTAAGIAALVEKYAHNLDSPIYMDYNGTPRPW